MAQDLRRIEAMVREMKVYLSSDMPFSHELSAKKTPTVTVGGYLIRQNRLLALRSSNFLNKTDQNRLDAAISYFDQVLYQNGVEFKQKVCQELEEWLHQWDKYLWYLDKEEVNPHYSSAVETRVIIEDIFQKIYILSYDVEPHIAEKIEQLDLKLRQYWQPGNFIWPAEWQSVYPQKIYWWLYGKPCNKLNVGVRARMSTTYVAHLSQTPA
ncbi:MAG: hypothetical protein HYR94_04695 [Chloroflexi bacterium]|nr:hypothetical protein [Chloroflexota bacterium]